MDDLDHLWRDDRLIEAAARGDIADADDAAAGPLRALSGLADARPLPRLDVDVSALVDSGRSHRYAVRSLAVAVTVVATLSTTGVAAVVTGDPFRPAKAVWHQIQDHTSGEVSGTQRAIPDRQRFDSGRAAGAPARPVATAAKEDGRPPAAATPDSDADAARAEPTAPAPAEPRAADPDATSQRSSAAGADEEQQQARPRPQEPTAAPASRREGDVDGQRQDGSGDRPSSGDDEPSASPQQPSDDGSDSPEDVEDLEDVDDIEAPLRRADSPEQAHDGSPSVAGPRTASGDQPAARPQGPPEAGAETQPETEPETEPETQPEIEPETRAEPGEAAPDPVAAPRPAG